MCLLFIAETLSQVQGRCSSEVTELARAAVVFRECHQVPRLTNATQFTQDW